ncbi:MAG: O-antigen ligase family protein [Verrucomicrobiota bacterium]
MVFTQKNFDWWCQRGILTLVLAALVFTPLAFGGVYTWTFLVVQMLALGVAGLWLARLWGGYKPKLLWPPLAWAVVAFVLYAAVRYFTSDIEYVARLELTRILLYAFLLLAVLSNLYDQDAAETVAYTLTAVAVLASSYAVAQYCRHSSHVWNLTAPYPGRGTGTYINPDHFAGFLELVLPLPLAFLLAGRVGIIARIILGYATLTILAGLTVTFSRGGWVAAGAGLLVLLGCLLCHRNHRLRAFVVLAVLVAGGALFTKFYLSHSVTFMRRLKDPDQAGPAVVDAASRLETWGGAVRMWQDHVWWGVGPGQFDYRFRQYRPPALQLRPEHAHDDYLELLDEMGLAGAVIVAAGAGIFIFGLKRSWPHVRREENDFGSGTSNRYAFFLGAVGGLCALAVHSLVDFNMHIPANALAGVAVLGLVASNLRFATKRYWVRARLPLQCALTVVLGGFIIFFGRQTWGRAGELVWTDRAEVLPPFSDEQAGALEKALAFEPSDFLTAYHLGECFRTRSWEGGDNYVELAEKALKFYELGARLNPYDELCPLRSGMCLDWTGRHTEAEKYYSDAEMLDPNGNWVVANIGWHYLQIGDYAAARQWFLRAERLSNWENDTARVNRRDICEPKLADRASGRLPLQLYYHGKDN